MSSLATLLSVKFVEGNPSAISQGIEVVWDWRLVTLSFLAVTAEPFFFTSPCILFLIKSLKRCVVMAVLASGS